MRHRRFKRHSARGRPVPRQSPCSCSTWPSWGSAGLCDGSSARRAGLGLVTKAESAKTAAEAAAPRTSWQGGAAARHSSRAPRRRSAREEDREVAADLLREFVGGRERLYDGAPPLELGDQLIHPGPPVARQRRTRPGWISPGGNPAAGAGPIQQPRVTNDARTPSSGGPTYASSLHLRTGPSRPHTSASSMS